MFSYGRCHRNFLNRKANRGSVRALLSIAVALLWLLGLLPKPAGAEPLRILGNSSITLIRIQTAASSGVQLSGALRDEREHPISGGEILLPKSVAIPCELDSNVTDSDGIFCFILPQASLSDAAAHAPRVELVFEGNEYFGRTSQSVPLVASRFSARLGIELSQATWSLSDPSHAVEVTLLSDDDSSADRFHVQLWLEREAVPRKLLGTESISKEKQATFSVASDSLGEPGEVRLSATLELGAEQIAREEQSLLLVAVIELAWANPPNQVRPDDGFDSVIAVSSPLGAVDGGWIETHVGDTVVGLAKVEGGVATVTSQFSAPRRAFVTFGARYLSETAWYVAGSPIATRLELLPPSPWRHLPWLVLLAGLAVWVVRMWRRPPSRQERRAFEGATQPVQAGLRVIASTPAGSGWVGTVRDAHTMKPLNGAQLQLTVPAVEEASSVLAATSSGTDGTFLLDPARKDLPEGSRLVIRAPWHSTLKLPLPPPGTVEVLLLSRRWTLLSHLVRWAEQSGAPFARGPSTTPAQVASAASKVGYEAAQVWAIGVEEAAFGRQPPDAHEEERLLTHTPPLVTRKHSERDRTE